MEENLDLPANPEFIKILDLDEGATWREVVERVEFLKQLPALMREEVERVVDEAVQPDEQGLSKIFPRERADVVRIGLDHGLRVLSIFLEERQWITPALRRRAAERVAAVAIDRQQAAINVQVGVSEEVFRKYNSDASDSSSIDSEQQRMNRLVGITAETFLKYTH